MPQSSPSAVRSLQCDGCGALCDAASHASCPYCGAAFAAAPRSEGDDNAAMATAAVQSVKKLYMEGKSRQALGILANLFRQNPALDQDAEASLLQAKLLLETDAAAGEIRRAIDKAYVLAPTMPEVLDYRTLVEAREKLDLGLKKPGEEALRTFLTRKPNHAHASLLLGIHLFWTQANAPEALRYLERAVQSRPNMLRAWACLGAVYAAVRRDDLAEKAFRRCVELETNPKLLEYYRGALAQLRGRG